MDDCKKSMIMVLGAVIAVGGFALLFNHDPFREAFFESELFRNPLR